MVFFPVFQFYYAVTSRLTTLNVRKIKGENYKSQSKSTNLDTLAAQVTVAFEIKLPFFYYKRIGPSDEVHFPIIFPGRAIRGTCIDEHGHHIRFKRKFTSFPTTRINILKNSFKMPVTIIKIFLGPKISWFTKSK